MSIGTHFDNWQLNDAPAHAGCSPALRELHARLEERWPGWKVLGCYAPRNVRGSTARSSHAYGAAIDLSYQYVGRERLDADVIPYLVSWSQEWHLQAIHDYVQCRIWRAGRTAAIDEACTKWWKAQRADNEGMGKPWATWIHLEVTRDGWGNAQHWDERGAG